MDRTMQMVTRTEDPYRKEQTNKGTTTPWMINLPLDLDHSSPVTTQSSISMLLNGISVSQPGMFFRLISYTSPRDSGLKNAYVRVYYTPM